MALPGRIPLLLFLLLFALLLAVGLGVRSCGRAKAVSETAIERRAEAKASESDSRRDAGAPRPEGDPHALRAGNQGDARGGEPHRLTALTFVMDRSGLKVAGTLTTPGRAKAPPTSVSPHQLEFSLQDARGAVVYQGALDHPLRRVEEYEDPARPGELKRLERELESEAFQLRYPAGLGARAVTFVERVTVDGQLRRTTLGTFSIP